MELKNVELLIKNPPDVLTEITYEVASARADGIELMCFTIKVDDAEELSDRRVSSAVTKVLKGLKEKGLIQFFATPSDFKRGSTEASFLINKYPTFFDNLPRECDGFDFVYVKI